MRRLTNEEREQRKCQAVERTRQWRKDNPERTREMRARYREKYRERITEKNRQRYAENIEAERERSRRFRAEQSETARATVRRYKAAHVDRVRAAQTTRNHRKRCNGAVEHFSHREIAERDGWACHICGDEVTRADWSIDHLVPLSLGGEHTRANVKIAHRSCNASRGNRDLSYLVAA